MSEKPVYAILAEFDTPAGILHAAKAIQGQGFTRWDVFTPFPVHGMNRAMGMRNSRVGWFAFAGAIGGFLAGIVKIWWMNASNYPIIVGGKPMFSLWAAFPTAFELAVLFGALGAVFGMLFLSGLPRLHHPLLKNRRFALATHDRFYLVIETADPKYLEYETRRLLEQTGSRHIEEIGE